MAAKGESDREPVTLADASAELVAKVEGMRERARVRGPRKSTEQPVDWMTGEGQTRLDWLLRVAGVPDQYRHPTIDRCRIKTEVEDWCWHALPLIEAGKGAIIFGPVGTGKSSTAALLTTAAVKLGKKVRWSYVPDLCDQMLNQYRRQEIRGKQVEPDVLVWDDFGVRPFAQFELGVLDQIVESRYRLRKTMIVTTNLTVEQLQAPEFARLRDRWRERCAAWVIGGKSQREGVT